MSLIVLSEQDDWTEYLRRFLHLDVSYTKEYVQLYAKMEQGTPEAVFFKSGENEVFYPYLVRRLDGWIPGYADLVSIGYGGPFVVGGQTAARLFQEQFHVYCRYKNYLTETVRFHPLLGNAELFADQMRLDLVRMVTAVDLRPTLAYIRAHYTQNVGRNMRKAAANEVRVTLGGTDRLHSFIQMHRETMDRNQAAAHYYYAPEIFGGLMKKTALCKPRLLLAIHEDRPVAGVLLLSGNQFAHYQLGASHTEDMALGVNHLLFDAMIQQAKQDGAQLLLLGGGNLDGDGLFRFKSSFANGNHFPYWMGKKVHDEEVYLALCQKLQVDQAGEQDFFPAYRNGGTSK
ncbi:GNAT family N-acetyltransferase [Brevibacillus formosus]|uniref:GNAT family N-acetyltransferase n=1 Tax=Brevibacillus formosus TaxID=54913 RepID=UPI003F1D2A6D